MIVVTGIFVLQACTTDPYTGQRKMSKTGWGSIIGAASGAAVGAATGRDSGLARKEGAHRRGRGSACRRGCGRVHGQAGGQAQAAAPEHGRECHREGDRIYLNMPGNITFKTDSSDINAGFYDVLNSVAWF